MPVISSFLNKFSKNQFLKNISILASANGFAYLISVFFTPFITRVYSPEDYGNFAVFNALASNLSMLATLNYTNAILLPRRSLSRLYVVTLSLLSSLLFCTVVTLTLYFWRDSILGAFDIEAFGGQIYWLPVYIIINSVFQSVSALSIHYKEFLRNAKGKLYGLGISKPVVLGYGLFLGSSPGGLVLGFILERLVHSVCMMGLQTRLLFKGVFRGFRLKRLVVIARRYKSYPLFALPGNYIGILIITMPPLVFSRSFGSSNLGHYSLAVSILNLVMLTLGSPIAQVFFQRAVEINFKTPEDLKYATWRVARKLVFVAVIPFSIVMVFGDLIFPLLFGAKWKMAGELAGYMSLYFAMELVSFPIICVYRVLRKEKAFLVYQTFSFLVLVSAMFYGTYLTDFKRAILIFSIAMAVVHFLGIMFSFHLLRLNRRLRFIFEFAFLFIITFGLMYAIRMQIGGI